MGRGGSARHARKTTAHLYLPCSLTYTHLELETEVVCGYPRIPWQLLYFVFGGLQDSTLLSTTCNNRCNGGPEEWWEDMTRHVSVNILPHSSACTEFWALVFYFLLIPDLKAKLTPTLAPDTLTDR